MRFGLGAWKCLTGTRAIPPARPPQRRAGARSNPPAKPRRGASAESGYTAKHIEVLEGLEPVRRRLVQRFPFAILYQSGPGDLSVIAVMHLRRRPDYWTKRVPVKSQKLTKK